MVCLNSSFLDLNHSISFSADREKRETEKQRGSESSPFPPQTQITQSTAASRKKKLWASTPLGYLPPSDRRNWLRYVFLYFCRFGYEILLFIEFFFCCIGLDSFLFQAFGFSMKMFVFSIFRFILISLSLSLFSNIFIWKTGFDFENSF